VSTEAVVGGVVGPIARPCALVLGRRDPATGQLRIAGRTTVLRPAQAEQMGALLRPAGPDHPWQGRITTASWGRRAEPVVVVEVAPDTAVTAGRWRHALPLLRIRAELSPEDVPEGSGAGAVSGETSRIPPLVRYRGQPVPGLPAGVGCDARRGSGRA
jgi:hypothetical protein